MGENDCYAIYYSPVRGSGRLLGRDSRQSARHAGEQHSVRAYRSSQFCGKRRSLGYEHRPGRPARSAASRVGARFWFSPGGVGTGSGCHPGACPCLHTNHRLGDTRHSRGHHGATGIGPLRRPGLRPHRGTRAGVSSECSVAADRGRTGLAVPAGSDRLPGPESGRWRAIQ